MQQNLTVYGFSLVLAPLLMFISGFFWIDGEYGVKGGTILILSIVFWVISIVYLFGLIKLRIAAWAMLFSIFGFISGALFGFVGVMVEILDISHQSYIESFEKYPTSSGILLFWSGPLAPLSLILLGILQLKGKITPAWVAILFILGGIAFPVSRISRNEWLAHTADILLLIPMWWVAMQIFTRRMIVARS